MDILRDNSFRVLNHIAQIAGEGGMPDYVMNNNIHDTKTASVLDADLFADPANRAYPVDSPHATWMSAAYLAYHTPAYQDSKQAAVSGFLSDTISKAAAVYGITSDVEGVRKKIAASRKPEDNDSDYGIPEQKRYRVTSSDELKTACDYFDANRGEYPSDTRRTVAAFLVKKAAEYSADWSALPDSVRKEAGYGLPDVDMLKAEIAERAKLASDADTGAVLANLVRVLDADDGTMLSQGLDKIASILDDFDQVSGLDTQLGRKVPFVADVLYAGNLNKAASDTDYAVTIGTDVFDCRKLAGVLDHGLVRDSMGAEFAAKCGKVDLYAAIEPAGLKKALDGLNADGRRDFINVVRMLCD